MTDRIRNWLPAGALERGAARTWIAEAVGAWSRAWFASAPLVVSGIQVVLDPPAADSDALWRPGRSAALRCPPRAAQRLVDRALGRRRPDATATEADRRLLEAFEQRLLDDLIMRLDTLLVGAVPAGKHFVPTAREPFGGDGGVLAQVADASGETLIILAMPLG